MESLTLGEILALFGAGAAGAFVKDIVVDNALVLPQLCKGRLILGSIGSILIGALAGYFVDHSPLMAFFAGFAGFSALEALSPRLSTATDSSFKKLEKDMPKKLETAIGPATVNSQNKVPKLALPFSGNYIISQKFGGNAKLYAPFGYAGHFGIDFVIPNGSPITPCDCGIVSRVGFSTGNGYFIEISHSWGKSLYLHFREQSTAKLGLMVKKSNIIGYCGNTGFVIPKPTKQKPYAGTHLHFSISINGVKNTPFKNFVDPLPYFAK